MSESPSIPAEATIQAPAPARDIRVAAKGGGIIFFGLLLSLISRFVFGIIVARTLGAAGFGLYNLAQNAEGLLLGASTLGLHVGVVHFLPIALQKRDDRLAWGLIQTGLAIVGVVSTLMGLILLGSADLVADRIFHEPALAPLLRIISVCIPLTALGRILTAVTRGFKKMQYTVYADDIVFNIVKLGLTVLFLSIGLGAAGAVLGHVIAWAVEVPLLVYFVHRLFSLRRPIHAAQRNARELLSFSLPIYISGLVDRVGGNLQVMVLGAVGTISLVGIYSGAARYQAVAVMFLVAMQTAVRPIISDLHYQGRMDELKQLYQAVTKWSLGFTLPFFLVAVLFSGPLLGIFGKEFKGGSLALVILFIGTLFNAGTGTCEPMITMTGYSKLKLVNAVVGTTMTIGLAWLMVPLWGIIGAAVATGLSVAIMNIAMTIQVYVLLKLTPYNRHIFKPIIAGLVAFLVTFLLHQLVPGAHWPYLVVKISFLCLVYVAVNVLLGLSEEDKMILRSVQRRFGIRLWAGR